MASTTKLKLENGQRIKQGGFLLTVIGRPSSPGADGRIELNYLSSFTFRQAFTESFNEAVFSESLIASPRATGPPTRSPFSTASKLSNHQ